MAKTIIIIIYGGFIVLDLHVQYCIGTRLLGQEIEFQPQKCMLIICTYNESKHSWMRLVYVNYLSKRFLYKYTCTHNKNQSEYANYTW